MDYATLGRITADLSRQWAETQNAGALRAYTERTYRDSVHWGAICAALEAFLGAQS